jgi:pimeloyl-ACP methyl ester carboxylesterase
VDDAVASTAPRAPTSTEVMMSTASSSSSRRRLLLTSAAASVFGLVLLASWNARAVPAPGTGAYSKESKAPVTGEIHPFHVAVPDAVLVELRQRIAATRWPDRETVADRSQGAQLAKLQELVRYWGSGYDWRKVEAKLNALPQFTTNIDGIDIHFIHVRSRQKNALPVIITHGWPGSVLEFVKVVGPLTDPTANGGRAEDAFDVVIPSIPGYGFSGKPTGTGWDPDRIARAWAELMKRLGYTRYVAQGGDWGAPISSAMARQGAPGLLGIHLNLPATVPPEVEAALNAGGPPPAGLTEQERAVFEALKQTRKKGTLAYGAMMGARPQAVGYGLTDSPAGLAAWLLVHPGFDLWTFGDDPEKAPTKDEVLDDITLYWVTNSATSSARLYWENKGGSPTSAAGQKTAEISLPVAITVFPEDVYRAPETWARRAYRNLIYFHEVDRGGHFAAWEQPELFTAELRAAFRPLRKAKTNVARP